MNCSLSNVHNPNNWIYSSAPLKQGSWSQECEWRRRLCCGWRCDHATMCGWRPELTRDQWPHNSRLKAQIKIADNDAELKTGCFPSNIVCVNAVSELVWARAGDGRRWDDPISAGAVAGSASKSSIRRFVITKKAPTRAFSWLKAATTAFTFKTLLRHYAKRTLTP